MTVPELCVGAIAADDAKLLMVRRARPPDAGSWSIPGGRVEWGETLAEAVVREVAEETGLEVMCGELVGWAERIRPRRHFVILDFAVTVLGWADPVPGDDASDARWVALSEVDRLELAPGLLQFLEDHGVLGWG